MQIGIGRLFWFLFCLASLSSSLSWGGTVSVAWDPNSEPDLAGYRVYFAATEHGMIDVGNQTNATLSDLQEGLTYTIYATAYNTAGLESAPSEPITYTVPSAALPPAITTHPLSQTVIPGQPFTFAVEATGAAALAYEWFKNGAPIATATSPTFSVAAAALSDAGTYTVLVSNPAGEITSHPATLTVIAAPPAITAHPLSQTVSQGQSVALSVQATGTGPLAYQWFKDGSAIPGATGAAFAIAAATAADAAAYHVRVTSPSGGVTSDTARLSVNVPPVIQIQPAPKTVTAGAPVTISVRATAMPPPKYQWFRNGTAIPGATGSTYSLSSAAETDAGDYSALVSNIAGEVRSATARLEVIAPSRIASLPASSGTVNSGQDIVPPSASLSLALDGETLRITGAATPGTTCLLQSCADLARGEWTTIQTVTIDATGQFQIELPRDPAQKLQLFRTILAEP